MTDLSYGCSSCQKPIPFGVAYCPVCGQPQRPGTSQLWLGERRLVTTLFADLASFTAASENTDPEDLIDMLNQVFSRLMAHCDQEGGYLDKTVGDQLMVLFGAPRAHEDDPARAVRAALKMQETMEELAPLMREKVGTACKINIGINTGPVVWGRMGPPGRAAATVIGDAVNLACRLQQFATGGQIVVSDTVYHQTQRFFEYEVLDPIRVKGKSSLIPIYMPLRPRQNVGPGSTSTQIGTDLIERGQELQILHAHWSRAITGYPQFVLLTGAAGLGKSRLLAEFINSLENYAVDKRPLILQAHSQAGSGGNYFPLTDLLNQLFGLAPADTDLIVRRKVEDRARILGINGGNFLPLMGYLLGWYQDNAHLSETRQDLDYLDEAAIDAAAALFFKQASRRPTLLLIDDLQWADASTLQWLKQLAIMKQMMMQAEDVGYGLMVLAASRPQPELSIEVLAIDNTITVPPLSEMARRELMAHLLPGPELPEPLIERLSRESEGNPFYLEEAVRGLVQSGQLVRRHDFWGLTRTVEQINVPLGIEGLVMANLDALDPVAQIVLQHASVIGLHFSRELLAAITPVDNLDAPLLELQQRGLIKEAINNGAGQSFTFIQTIVREVIYHSILRKTRRELHERIARLTEAKIAPQADDMVSLAYHYAAGGNQEKTVVYNWLTGQRAFDQFDFEKAYHHLELAWNALREIPAPDPDIERNVTEALGDASTFIGNFGMAIACYQVIRDLIAGNPEELAVLHYKISRLHFYQANVEEAGQSYQQALEAASNNPLIVAQIEAEMRLLSDLG